MDWGKVTETSKAGSLCQWPFASSDPLVSGLDYLAWDSRGEKMMKLKGDSSGWGVLITALCSTGAKPGFLWNG